MNSADALKSRLVIGMATPFMLLACAANQAGVAEAVAHADQACARLTRAAQAFHLAGPSTQGRYRCEVQADGAPDFVFALRYQGTEIADNTSNLVGYYLVDRRSGVIHAWDITEGSRSPALAIDGDKRQ
jgi:hypothetical protein